MGANEGLLKNEIIMLVPIVSVLFYHALLLADTLIATSTCPVELDGVKCDDVQSGCRRKKDTCNHRIHTF